MDDSLVEYVNEYTIILGHLMFLSFPTKSQPKDLKPIDPAVVMKWHGSKGCSFLHY